MKKVMIMLSLLLTLGLGAETTLMECSYSHEWNQNTGMKSYINDDPGFKLLFVETDGFIMTSHRSKEYYTFYYHRTQRGQKIYANKNGVDVMYFKEKKVLTILNRGNVLVFNKCRSKEQ